MPDQPLRSGHDPASARFPCGEGPTRRKSTCCAERHPAFRLNLHVPSKVTGETLYIKQPDEEDQTKLVKCPLDLQEYLAAGLLAGCDFQNQAEIELFVRMAAQLGDGEAACFAIATQRGWALATDDRRARKLAADIALDRHYHARADQALGPEHEFQRGRDRCRAAEHSEIRLLHPAGKRSRVRLVDEALGPIAEREQRVREARFGRQLVGRL